MAYTPEQARLAQIFHPYAFPKFVEVQEKQYRFIHYTSAEGAFCILKSNEFWLRNAYCMNDYSEIFHGEDCLKAAIHGPTGERFRRALTALHPEMVKRLEDLFGAWLPHIKNETYVGCFTQHGEVSAQLGKLSMWRAYGTVALELNNTAFLSESEVLKAYSSPVFYADAPRFAAEMLRIADNIESNIDFLRGLKDEELFARLFNMLRLAITCTKSEAFEEEQEWRVVYTKPIDKSRIIKCEPEMVGSVPQLVCKIPLKSRPEDKLVGLSIPELVNRIIIGPCRLPWALRDAFVHLLKAHKVKDAEQRVIMTNIPLRT